LHKVAAMIVPEKNNNDIEVRNRFNLQRKKIEHRVNQLTLLLAQDPRTKIQLHVKFEREYPGHGRVVLFTAGDID
jgi:hypothetical protein